MLCHTAGVIVTMFGSGIFGDVCRSWEVLVNFSNRKGHCITCLVTVTIVHDGVLPLCFIDTVLFGVNSLALIVLGGWKYLSIRRQTQHSIPYSKTQALKMLLITALSIFPAVQTIYHLFAGRLYLYETVANVHISLTWLFALFLVAAEYSRGMKNTGVVRIWCITTFVINSLYLQSTLALTRRGQESGYDLTISIMDVAASTILAIIATFVDKKPKGYEQLDTGDDSVTDKLLSKTSGRDIAGESNIISRVLFQFINPLLKLGFRRALQQPDLPILSKYLRSAEVNQVFRDQWVNEKDRPKPSFWKVIARSFGRKFVLGGLFKLGNDLSQFVGPIMLGKVVAFIQSSGKEEDAGETYQGLLLVAALSGSMLLTSFFQNQYFYECYNVGMQSQSIGAMVNLQSIDAQKFQELIPFLHMIWSAPFQIFGSLFLLWRLLGVSALAGIGVMALLIPLNARISKYLANLHKEVMKQRDMRTKGMNEILNGIRIIKFFAWEDSFIQRIANIRQAEVNIMMKGLLVRAVAIFLWMASPLLVSTVTFAVYTLLGNDLSAEVAFSALALFNILRFPMNMLPNIITSLIEAKVSTDRLIKFLASEESDPQAVRVTSDRNTPSAVKLEDGSWNWDENVFPPVLSHITIDFKRGKLVAVVGPVGCGKSSLLSAILGDIPKLKGTAQLNGTKAYVAQQAWVQNATLRENIVFGSHFDQEKYERVLRVCELRADIDMLPHGDSTEIGEKGINLSGGQKQRVSLARAVYADRDIYLMDDCLSAVDAHVGKSIFDNCITGELEGKSRILVTHQLQFVSKADLIVEGKVAEMGTYKELMDSQGVFSGLITAHVKSPEPEHHVEEVEATNGKSNGKSNGISNGNSNGNGLKKSGNGVHKKPEAKKEENGGPAKGGLRIISDEQRGIGSIGWRLWKIYFLSMGFVILPLGVLINQFLEQTGRVASDFWLSHWASSIAERIHGPYFYLGIYVGLSMGCSVLVFIRAYGVSYAGITSATALHNRILQRVVRAPSAFFDTTPVGRVLNVFSRDVNVLDDALPRSIGMSLGSIMNTASSIFVISYIIPPFLTALIPLAYVYRYIQKYYLFSSRELKRLESISKSPIYAQFSETLAGVHTIKPYDRRSDFIEINNRRLDTNNQAFYCGQVANRWLSLRLDLIGATVVSISTVFAVIERENLDPGSVGLMLSYGLSMTGTLSWLVRTVTDTETQMVSVERIDGYAAIDSEETAVDQGERPPHGWPENGVIEFKDVKLRYRPGLDLVLKGVTMKIQSKEKIGVVGRTGAGKSSLMLALFRFVELDSGSITIDGHDISRTNLLQLRRGLSIIPQDPTLFTGTVRSNMDPFTESSDGSIWDALRSVHLARDIETLPEKLDAPVTEGGENFSVGQRQLLCLARAILRKSKILIMDEATAAVDFETDSLIQQTIRQEFKNTTVLTIAHRIHTIMDYDRIVVLDAGRVAEFDTPDNLLANPKGIFYSMTSQSGTAKAEK
ncbi:hypothetical protein PROFUN_00476 [Planoprotostelium fungivorum]|uniref:Uncharacterized protein n=1 Tax=Planoprotostelium fungivorum TaxID=1890364 RepID=A0A2P6N0Y1_9EUKA|nr:hypothetical protein PROFUN_00476 [Planoprotostelium fungivorum]